MRQRPADAARPVGAGQVQGLHRSALRQSIAFVGRQAERPRRVDQRAHPPRRRRPPPASAQSGARASRLLQQGSPGAQHLRQQDQAVRPVLAHRGIEARRVEAATSPTSRAAAAAARCSARRARSGARQPGDVLEQHRQRQRAQVAFECPAAPSPAAGPASPRCSASARRHTPLGAPVVPDVKVTLAVPAGMATGAAGRRSITSVSPASGQARAGTCGHCAASGAADSSVSTPAARNAWAHLRRREEQRQRHVHDRGLCCRRIGDHPGRPVVEQRGQHAHAVGAQALRQHVRRVLQTAVRPVTAGAAQGDGRVRCRHAAPATAARRVNCCSARGRWPASTFGWCS